MYPVDVDGFLVRPSQHATVIPKTMAKAFRDKEKEYKAPPDDRIYCRACSTFIAAKIDAAGRVKCNKCECQHCSKCGDKWFEMRGHVCRSRDEQDAFKGLEQGKDYQICPSQR